MQDLSRLSRRINYEFKNKTILKQALTHRSADSKHNERFEFLGDSILNMVISNALFAQFPDQSEGHLSRLRSFLVKGEMLAKIALELDLGNYLLLGQGELKSGGFRRASTLADALEALFAAVFLDAGFDECQKVILHLYKTRLEDESLNYNLKDAKTQLQEYLQSKKQQLPEYTLTNVVGEEHEQIFYIVCTVHALSLSTNGEGDTRRKAEQVAAKKLLKIIKDSKKTTKKT